MNKKIFIKTVFIMFLMALPFRIVANDFLRGDCNNDGKLNIGDVTTLINWLLSGYTPEDNANETFTVNGVTFKMVAVEGGTFTMGATEEQVLAGAADDEYPAHQVTLSNYYIGETEVTQELWVAVMGTNPSNHQGDPKYPVDKVTWYDCQTFINQLNALTGRQFRLPTEAEWEYAARGGNKSEGYIYSGNSNIDLVAWYSGNAGNMTHPVASKQANELGLYDMSGNVWEWVQDWYDGNYYSNSPSTNPTGPETGTNRVYRGGSWGNYSEFCRVSFRDHYVQPSESHFHFGLRLAL